jgi:hypothetical protein
MVDALSDVRRVLTPDGLMIDLRPLLERWPVEVSWRGGYREAGKVTDLKESLAEDVAANAVMGEADSVMGFERERQQVFSFFYYWDTPKEMENYILENWNDVINVDDGVWNSLGASWASAGAEARVRLRMKLLISRYRNHR